MKKENCYCGHPKERHSDIPDKLEWCFHCSCTRYALDERERGEEGIISHNLGGRHPYSAKDKCVICTPPPREEDGDLCFGKSCKHDGKNEKCFFAIPSEEWEKEFDEKFPNNIYCFREYRGGTDTETDAVKEIKSFISRLLAHDRRKMQAELVSIVLRPARTLKRRI